MPKKKKSIFCIDVTERCNVHLSVDILCILIIVKTSPYLFTVSSLYLLCVDGL